MAMTSVSLAQVFIRDIVCLFLGLPSLCARYNTDCAQDTTQTARKIQHRLRARYNTDCARDKTQTAHEIQHSPKETDILEELCTEGESLIKRFLRRQHALLFFLLDFSIKFINSLKYYVFHLEL